MKNNQNEILKCEIRRKQMKTEKGGQPIKIRFSLAFKPFAGWGDTQQFRALAVLSKAL